VALSGDLVSFRARPVGGSPGLESGARGVQVTLDPYELAAWAWD
jgi:hypothetical protein